MVAQFPDQSATTPSAYVPLISAAVRAVQPYVREDIWHFFTLAAAHRDEMNLLYPGVRAFMGFGYSAEQVEPLYQQCIQAGLLRLVQERGRDRFGRYQPAVYQINPLVVYVDPRRYEIALALAATPFCALPGGYPDRRSLSDSDQAEGSPDRRFLSDSDQASDQVESNLREEPDRRFLSTSDQALFDLKQNQKAESGKQNHQGESEGESDKQNQPPLTVEPHQPRTAGTRSLGTVLSSVTADTGKGKSPAPAKATRSAEPKRSANSAPNTPPKPPASPAERKTRGDGSLKPYYQPMPMQADERVAVLFVKTAKDTRIEYARMYVDQYGGAIVMDVMARYQSTDESKRRSFKSATAIMVSWMQDAQRRAAAEQGQMADALYDIGDAYECQLAACDDSLSDDERAVYLDAYQRVHRGNEYSAIWRPQMIAMNQFESDEDAAARVAQAIAMHRAEKEARR